jgi:hypothetical protein
MKLLLLSSVLFFTGCATTDPQVNQGINRGLVNIIKHIK